MSRIPIFFILLSLLTIYTGLHAQRLWPAHPFWGWAGIFFFVGLMLVWQRVHRADQSDPESRRYKVLAWSGTIAMGVWATFLFFCFAIDLVSLILLAAQAIHPFPFNSQTLHLPALLVLISALLAALGLVQAVEGPRVIQVKVPIHALSPALEGFKIALLSDLHIGPTIGARYVSDVVDRTLELKPDMIAVTGDLADENVAKIAAQIAPLARLKAPQGIYYVTGNHEYYWGAEEWLAKVSSLGWIPLNNDNRTLSVKESSLFIAGITDEQGEILSPEHVSDLARAARGSEKSSFRMLLSHRPGIYAEAEKAGFQLQLSGHTHGGQFFPWSLVIPFAHRFYKDLNRFRRLWIYVSSGAGYWGPPHRFLVPSEITLLELVSARVG